MSRSLEQQPISSGEGEIEKGIAACLYLKKKEPDPLHWGGIDCSKLSKDEELLIEKFDELKQNPSEEVLFALDKDAQKLLEATGSHVVEVLINDLVAFRYELKHNSGKHNGNVH